MGGAGLEPTALARSKTLISENPHENGTKSGTPETDFDLSELIEVWPSLPAETRDEILRTIRKHKANAAREPRER